MWVREADMQVSEHYSTTAINWVDKRTIILARMVVVLSFAAALLHCSGTLLLYTVVTGAVTSLLACLSGYLGKMLNSASFTGI